MNNYCRIIYVKTRTEETNTPVIHRGHARLDLGESALVRWRLI